MLLLVGSTGTTGTTGMGCTTAAWSLPGAPSLGSRKAQRRENHIFFHEGGREVVVEWSGVLLGCGSCSLALLSSEFPTPWKRFSGTNPDLVLSLHALLCPGEQQGRGAGTGDPNLSPDSRGNPKILTFPSALGRGSSWPHAGPVTAAAWSSSGREIYLWDSRAGETSARC